MKPIFALAVLCLLAACGGGERPGTALPTPAFQADVATRNALAKQMFGAEQFGSNQAPAPYGSYAKGCLAGGVQLAETGPTWQAMRLSRNRNWGHPETVDYLQTLSRKAAQQPGWNGIYVGDISQPRGGPMLTGHASHQIGLDADIWLLPANRLNLSRDEREKISSISMRRSNGAYTNGNWTRAHHEIVKAAASDPRVARIFIFPGAKVQMCNDERGSKAWLNKVRPWYGHHYHFHVRLKCPSGARGCVDQAPQPAGDGCADAQAWVNNILNPPPPDPNYKAPPKKGPIRVADLPNQCQAVLSR
ncbi:penicillin-insensitive murein endopeptidase [Oceaniglobus ichthyenteri]|uniref:penicillin-insensitive murein endopeptidase n=1 Tax=Oceaniglobus ichthyenteri TaxID=2136177 RepID=UPI000D3A4575|nr:penicillin-insensitive murein endopeptidase [Oceaniglobus ichthyenteri]